VELRFLAWLLPLSIVEEDLCLTLPALSPTLPLPVEFVAGGDGRPESLESAPGLGGSGKSGRFELEEFNEPRKIAETGRLLEKEGLGRVVIEGSRRKIQVIN
jgi:hypothetical protein